MDRLVTPKAVAERYGCSLATARKYIRRCNPHMEHPLTTTEKAFREWEYERTVYRPLTEEEFNRIEERIFRGGRFTFNIPRRKD